MKLISSTFSKRLAVMAPVLGAMGFAIAVIVPSLQGGNAFPDNFVIFPFLLLVVMAFFFWKFFAGLADQVWDDGNSILLKIRGLELRIPLSEIVNVNYSSMTNPPRATVTLRNATQIGREFAFIPKRPFTLNPFAKNEIIEDLIARIDAQRRR